MTHATATRVLRAVQDEIDRYEGQVGLVCEVIPAWAEKAIQELAPYFGIDAEDHD